MKRIHLLLLIVLPVCFFYSCKKDSFITSGANVSFSADSLKFDTVFTSVGSITQSFKIFNNNDQKLLLSRVQLKGGTGSAFKTNINGTAAAEVDNIEIAANDSIYVFVTVTVNPNTTNLPFIISDSILINYNGNNRFIQLQAYGQNAHFLRNRVITTNTNWPNDLPYVILGSLQVDTAITLSISAGCKIYAHADAPFLVDGTLITNGIKDAEVEFAADRLDEPYKNFPGGWPGIYFRNTSKDNVLNFTNVKNAFQAVVVTGAASNANPKLTMHQCIINNAYDVGLLGYNSSVIADNSLISNCGKNISIMLGGKYNFTHCTVASFSNSYILHKNPVLFVSNYAELNGAVVSDNINAYFLNCIFWGDNDNLDNEVVCSKDGSTVFNVSFDHCLYKALNDPANAIVNNVIRNVDPSFDSIDVSHKYYDFRITRNPAAPGINQGAATGFAKDLDFNNRAIGLPDLGCYEKQ